MNWVAEHHYTMIIHQERLERARTSGKGLDLGFLREAWSALRKLATGGRAGLRERRTALIAHPSAANARPLEVQ